MSQAVSWSSGIWGDNTLKRLILAIVVVFDKEVTAADATNLAEGDY